MSYALIAEIKTKAMSHAMTIQIQYSLFVKFTMNF